MVRCAPPLTACSQHVVSMKLRSLGLMACLLIQFDIPLQWLKEATLKDRCMMLPRARM